MSKVPNDPLLQVETTCGSLLYELQIIWDEVGESETERDKMLLELERECLEVYRRKVDQANRCRAQLRQAIADAEADLAAICSAMGERPVHIRQPDQSLGSLKEELRAILPQLEEMQKRKCDRRNQFVEILEQIQKISNEIHMYSEYTLSRTIVDETDLSLRKLEELNRELQALQKEKSDRVKHVLDLLNTLNSLCLVLGIDFKETVIEVHPSLGNDYEGTKNMSNETIEQLTTAIQRLREIKIKRMQRLQDLATSMLELWNLMDTPIEEQQMFQNVTCNIAASEHEIMEPNMLSVEFINQVEAEVSRLDELKASKMKELVLKKRTELEEICRKTHLIPESDSVVEVAIEAIESGAVDPACVLEQIELQIAKVKEEAFSRKEILEKVEKWLAACDEECWLEEYNRDENRYNAGRGAHLTLKRAEKARALVGKLPGMVEALASKTTAWENERGIEFSYDGIRLLSMLEEYTILRQEKEEERKRQRDQKKLQGQLMAEQEALFGSKPSPMKLQNGKKGPRLSTGGASTRRLSVGGTMLQTPKADPHSIKSTPNTRQAKKSDRLLHPIEQLKHPRDDACPALSAGGRDSDVAGLPLRNHSLNAVNAREVESPMRRKPFSPISSTESSKSHAITNVMNDLNRKQNEMLQKTLKGNNSQFSTPSKILSAGEEENWTPKAMPIHMPPTPSTVSVPMQTVMTPAHPPIPYNRVEETPEEIEYSFEEKRAGFVLPRTTHLKTPIQV
ncbi:Microtubule-associated protein [Actinidia chinensis var. chinensis]|uniref:Microtubule-associated protein n=1 Tax=Actinidia chinensis var. chinensis TaxID=1590841 RepID=A0A2R6RQV8_ACTCC|nr:Microtubule-associated protein [Actinidia chinensis var. chinensis]